MPNRKYAGKRSFASGPTQTGVGATATESTGGSAALKGWGITEERVRQYDEAIRSGASLVMGGLALAFADSIEPAHHANTQVHPT